MIDQRRDVPVAERLDRMTRASDMGQAIAAVTAVTRREWMSRGHASAALDESAVNCSPFVHPLLRIASDAKCNASSGMRVDQERRMQSVERSAGPDLTPGGMR